MVVGISPTMLIVSALPGQLLAQPSPIKISLEFPSADPRGNPQRTVGGGRRGASCISVESGKPSLTALMPTRANQGNTVANNPQLYWYIPKTTATIGELVVKDELENEIYQTNFTVPGSPGIVKLTIPESATLKTGQKYRWFFTLICNPEDRSQDEYTYGSLQKTTLSSSLDSYLDAATPLKKAEIYAKYNIWQETLSNIAELKTEKPKEWEELLKSVGLEAIAKEPFLNCCTKP
ncbi:DUF928 domain-containing protein [Cronbergia sp. UHCC 0137]|uniref:DUF928 domain-containing protein n=1 Tax=Cronbergia sp. UHCC 0137 TaxID=3110239 RepID=UPI002B2187B9|nr:DUF928 domain-containing protein [Cronbergia sp. UHCC 0137]MEA5619380.1 DUF928 domain-containing protein [Cronbergia sp. UHCC 0137]